MRWRATLVLAGGLAGCTLAPGEHVHGHYFGYVRIVAPAGAPEGGVRKQVESVGAWIEVDPASSQLDSAGVGFRKSERLIIPLDCRLAVIVRNEAQLAAARDLFQALEGREACAIDATER